MAILELLLGGLGVFVVAICDVPKRIRVATTLTAIFLSFAVIGGVHLVMWTYGDVAMFGYGRDVIDNVLYAVLAVLWLAFLYFFVTDPVKSQPD